MGIKVRKEFGDIIDRHNSILGILKGQKARNYTIFEKYRGNVQKELDIPSNKYLSWYNSVQPFVDSLESGQYTDSELNQAYEKFVRELVKFESNFVTTQEQINELEDYFDILVYKLVRLEQKIVNNSEEFTKKIHNLQIKRIKKHQQLPENERIKKHHCKCCGDPISVDKGDGETTCKLCNEIPNNKQPAMAPLEQTIAKRMARAEKNPDNVAELFISKEDEPESNFPSEKEFYKEDEPETPKPETDTIPKEEEAPKKERKPKHIRQIENKFENLMDKYNKKYEPEFCDEEFKEIERIAKKEEEEAEDEETKEET